MHKVHRIAFAWMALAVACRAADLPQADGLRSEPHGYDLARRGVATLEDAYRQFLSLAVSQERIKLESSVRDMSFAEVTAQLEELCLIDSGWDYRPDYCLRRDVLAYMCTTYMKCRTGLFTSLCGVTRRYAHREMLYRGVVARGAPNSYVSGAELLSVITRVAQLTETRPEPTLTEDEIH